MCKLIKYGTTFREVTYWDLYTKMEIFKSVSENVMQI